MSELRQAVNELSIEGVLLEKSFEEREINGKNAIMGELEVEIGENETHTINMFSFELTNAQKPNGFFKGIKTIADEFQSVQDVGRDEASKVRTYQANLNKNEYVGRDGVLKSYNRINANAVNRLNAGDTLEPQAKFQVEVYIQAILPEIKNEEETGRLIIKGLIAQYGGKVEPFDFVVQGEKEAGFVEGNYEVGDTVMITGNIINTVVTETKVTEMAFGEDVEDVKTSATRELVVTGGSMPYEEEQAYSTEIIKKALAQREILLEEKKDKAQSKANNPASKSTGATGGFGTMDNKEKSDYEIPF